MAPTIKVGDTIPEGTFSYVPYTPELENGLACGIPTKTSTADWKGKKVVLFSVPGAFTPTCHVNHLPPILAAVPKFKEKGADLIVGLAANDPFVLSGWGRVEGVKDQIILLSDPNATWAASLGLSVDLSAVGFGIRTARFGLIIDDLVVKYIGEEPAKEVTVSGADALLAAL